MDSLDQVGGLFWSGIHALLHPSIVSETLVTPANPFEVWKTVLNTESKRIGK